MEQRPLVIFNNIEVNGEVRGVMRYKEYSLRMRKVMVELHKAVASAKKEQLAESAVTEKRDPKEEDTKERK